MKNKTINAIIIAATTGGLMLGIALPAFAQLGVSAGAGASASLGGGALNVNGSLKATIQANIIARSKDRADQEITRRDDAMTKLSARIQEMQKLSADEKSSLSGEIQSQLDAMASLKAKIDADNDTSSLKIDVQSITKAYRIFMLIMPQASIAAASDRAETMVDTANTLGAKIQARIAAAQAAGKDVSAEQTAYADFQAKVADANVQAQASVTETQSLKPDNGDQTVMQSNEAALKDARTKLHVAQQDLVAARQDAGTIVKALIKLGGGASASGSASGSVSGTATGGSQ